MEDNEHVEKLRQLLKLSNLDHQNISLYQKTFNVGHSVRLFLLLLFFLWVFRQAQRQASPAAVTPVPVDAMVSL